MRPAAKVVRARAELIPNPKTNVQGDAMLRRAFSLFTIECVVLAILLCREWTLHYISGPADTEYQSVYRTRSKPVIIR